MRIKPMQNNKEAYWTAHHLSRLISSKVAHYLEWIVYQCFLFPNLEFHYACSFEGWLLLEPGQKPRRQVLLDISFLITFRSSTRGRSKKNHKVENIVPF